METLKKALLKLVNFSENLEGSLQDNKLSFMEYATLAGNLGTATFFIFQNFKTLVAELGKLDEQGDEGRKILKEYLKVELDLQNDRAEMIFEETFGLLLALVAYVKAIINRSKS